MYRQLQRAYLCYLQSIARCLWCDNVTGTCEFRRASYGLNTVGVHMYVHVGIAGNITGDITNGGEMAVSESLRDGEEEEGRGIREEGEEDREEAMESREIEAVVEELTTPMDEGSNLVQVGNGGTSVATPSLDLQEPPLQQEEEEEESTTPIPSPGCCTVLMHYTYTLYTS